MAKRASKRTPAPARMYVRKLRTDRRHFSCERFRAWCVEEFGEQPSAVKVARRLNSTPQTVYALWSGERQPSLETALRMAAAGGVPFDEWLDGVFYKT